MKTLTPPESSLEDSTAQEPASHQEHQSGAASEKSSGPDFISPPPSKPLLSRYEGFLVPALVLFMVGNAMASVWPQLPFMHSRIGLSLLAILMGIICISIGKVTRNTGALAKQSRWAIRLCLWLILLIGGGLYYQQFHFIPASNDVRTLAPLDHADVMGTVTRIASGSKAVVQVKSVNNHPVSGQVLASLPEDTQGIEAGTRVLMTADLRLPFHSRIPGAFDQQRYLENQQITAVLKHAERLVAFETSQAPQYFAQRLTDSLKTRISTSFSRNLPSPQAEVLGGLVLGDKAIPVDRDTRQAFIQTGLVHVLAASGMNVGIIAAAAFWLLSLLKLPYRMKLGITMGAVALYSLLTGLPPSIQRATTMLELALALKMLDRTLSPVFLLCLTGALLVAFAPENIASIGFQFSMLTTFGLVTMVSPLQEKLGYYMTRKVAGALLVPIIAQLWVWPLSVFYFNQFPIHSVPLNLLSIALVAPLTIIGFISGLLSLLLPVLGEWSSWLARPFLDALLWLVHWGNDMTWAKWSLPSPAPWLLLALYVQLFVLASLAQSLKKWPTRQKLLVALIPLAFILGGLCLEKAQAQHTTQIALLPFSVEHEGILIQPAGSNSHLIVLPVGLRYFESRALADYLKHRHITRLDAVILFPATDSNTFVEAGFPPQTTELHTLLKTAFRDARPNAIITTPELAGALESISDFTIRVIPTKGTRLQVGTIALDTAFPQLRLLSGHHCLLSWDEHYQADSTCGLQAVNAAHGLRFFLQNDASKPLPPHRFYRLSQQNGQMVLHEGTP